MCRGLAVAVLDRAAGGDDRLRQHLTAEDPPVRHRLAAADEDVRLGVAEVGLVVAGAVDADVRRSDGLQVEDVQQVLEGVQLGGFLGRGHVGTISGGCDDGRMTDRESTERPYRVDVPLRWSDMDAYGHVNNVQFLRLLEDARVIGFQEWFGQDRSMLDEGVLVARHEIEYLAPLEFRIAPIQVDMWATQISGASFDLAYEVRDPASVGDALYARAETTLVAYDFTTAKPRRLRPKEREVLKRRLRRAGAVPLASAPHDVSELHLADARDPRRPGHVRRPRPHPGRRRRGPPARLRYGARGVRRGAGRAGPDERRAP